jgi:hypothetical protein
VASLKLGWLACVGGAALGRPGLGPLVVAPLLVVHLKLASDSRSELLLMAQLAALGFVLDSALAASGLMSYAGAAVPPAAPLWIVALWCLLATTLRSSLRWLAGRPGLAAVTGGFAGPIGYLAAERLGALSLTGGRAPAVAAMALAWGLAIPMAMWLSSREPTANNPADVGARSFRRC